MRVSPTLVTRRHSVAKGSWGLDTQNMNWFYKEGHRIGSVPQGEEGERVARGVARLLYLGTISGSWVREEVVLIDIYLYIYV